MLTLHEGAYPLGVAGKHAAAKSFRERDVGNEVPDHLVNLSVRVLPRSTGIGVYVGHEISVQLVEELLDALFGHAVMQPHVRRMNDARCGLGRPPFELCASFARKAIKYAFDVFLLSCKSEYVFAVGEMHGGWGGSDKKAGRPYA